eukprot:1755341-Amphidinium_carterae.1
MASGMILAACGTGVDAQVEAVAVVENQEDSVKAELCTDGSIDADAAAEAIAANKVPRTSPHS